MVLPRRRKSNDNILDQKTQATNIQTRESSKINKKICKQSVNFAVGDRKKEDAHLCAHKHNCETSSQDPSFQRQLSFKLRTGSSYRNISPNIKYTVTSLGTVKIELSTEKESVTEL